MYWFKTILIAYKSILANDEDILRITGMFILMSSNCSRYCCLKKKETKNKTEKKNGSYKMESDKNDRHNYGRKKELLITKSS